MSVKKINEKIDNILNMLNAMNVRISSLENTFESRLSSLEAKLLEKNKELKNGMTVRENRVTNLKPPQLAKKTKLLDQMICLNL